MRNPALPATMRTAEGELITDLDPVRCVGCETVIFNSRSVVDVRGKLYCSESCANRAALRKLRNTRALPY